jgi:hypothetical protein
LRKQLVVATTHTATHFVLETNTPYVPLDSVCMVNCSAAAWEGAVSAARLGELIHYEHLSGPLPILCPCLYGRLCRLTSLVYSCHKIAGISDEANKAETPSLLLVRSNKVWTATVFVVVSGR